MLPTQNFDFSELAVIWEGLLISDLEVLKAWIYNSLPSVHLHDMKIHPAVLQFSFMLTHYSAYISNFYKCELAFQTRCLYIFLLALRVTNSRGKFWVIGLCKKRSPVLEGYVLKLLSYGSWRVITVYSIIQLVTYFHSANTKWYIKNVDTKYCIITAHWSVIKHEESSLLGCGTV
jgi:hypothetical protein